LRQRAKVALTPLILSSGKHLSRLAGHLRGVGTDFGHKPN
jgi:hypothetical protein